MRFVGRGHPAVRASHTKTFEFAPGDELTERGTCILAVGTEVQPPQPLAGPVRLRITAGGHSATVEALANSSWDPSGPIVIRRSPLRLPGTFATHADAAAADLPRELVAALSDPDALVTVDVVAVPTSEDTVVLFAADAGRPDDPRLRAEYDAADEVDRQDAGARKLVAGKHADPGRRSRRRLVVATSALPRPDPGQVGLPVEVVGLMPQLAVAAASVTNGPLTVVPDDSLREWLPRLPAAHRVVGRTTPQELPALLLAARQRRASAQCVLAQPAGPVLRADLDELPTLYGRDDVFVCFEATSAPGIVDPDVRAAITGLLAEGVTTKTAASALARLTGMARRAAYDAVLDLAGSEPR